MRIGLMIIVLALLLSACQFSSSDEPDATFIVMPHFETISSGGMYTVGVRPDGTVVAIGNNYYNQLDVSNWVLKTG